MTQDARFEDGGERPVNLGALDAEDLQVLSALAQDAVFQVSDLTWDRTKRRVALLINRVRREQAGSRAGAPVERVRALLVISDVMGLAHQGLDPTARDLVLSLLSISFEPTEDGAGHIVLTLAGDGALRATVEALDVSLRDVTRPYAAPSGKLPQHPD